jgi:uncharacterized integral membrane protein (TIGR00697 family)
MKLNKTFLFTALSTLFVGSLLIANVIAFKLFEVWKFTLPAAVIIFPIVYIVNDVLAEVYGFRNARRVILLGFAVNLLAVISYNISMLLKAPAWFEGAEAFNTVLSSTSRVLIASLSAYLVGTTVNSYIITKMRGTNPIGEGGLFARVMISTVIGEAVDAMIFITIAFVGTMPIKDMFIMIAAQAATKTIYECIVFPGTKALVNYIKKLPVGSIFN